MKLYSITFLGGEVSMIQNSVQNNSNTTLPISQTETQKFKNDVNESTAQKANLNIKNVTSTTQSAGINVQNAYSNNFKEGWYSPTHKYNPSDPTQTQNSIISTPATNSFSFGDALKTASMPRYVFFSYAINAFGNRVVMTPLIPISKLLDGNVADAFYFKNIKWYISHRIATTPNGNSVNNLIKGQGIAASIGGKGEGGGLGLELGTLENVAPKGVGFIRDKIKSVSESLNLPEKYSKYFDGLHFTASVRADENGNIKHYLRAFIKMPSKMRGKKIDTKTREAVKDFVSNNLENLFIFKFGKEKAKILMAAKTAMKVATATSAAAGGVPGVIMYAGKFLTFQTAKSFIIDEINTAGEISFGVTYLTLETDGSGNPISNPKNLLPNGLSIGQNPYITGEDLVNAASDLSSIDVKGMLITFVKMINQFENVENGVVENAYQYSAKELETSKSISNKFGISQEQFEKDNNIHHNGYLRIGQSLIIQGAKFDPDLSLSKIDDGYFAMKLSNGGSLIRVSNHLNIPPQELATINKLDTSNSLFPPRLKKGQIIILPDSFKKEDVSIESQPNQTPITKTPADQDNQILTRNLEENTTSKITEDDNSSKNQLDDFIAPKASLIADPQTKITAKVASDFVSPKETTNNTANIIKPPIVSTYIIEKGDTLNEISSELDIPVQELRIYNNIPDINKINAGDELIIPSKTSEPINKIHNIKYGETLGQIANDNNITLKELLESNSNISNPNKIKTGDELIVPLASSKTSKPVSNENKIHNIKYGETLGQIANDNNITLKELLESNPNISNPNKINSGETLIIPANTIDAQYY